MREMERHKPVQSAYGRVSADGPNPAFQNHSFIDQRAALNLAQFSKRQDEIDVDADSLTKLVYALTAEAEGALRDGTGASEAVYNALGTNILGASEREQLLNVRKLIDLYLGSTDASASTSTPPSLQVQKPTEDDPSPAPNGMIEQLKHLAAASKPVDVRSEGGFESTRLSLDSAKDERGAVSAPSSRPSSRRERRTTRRSGLGAAK